MERSESGTYPLDALALSFVRSLAPQDTESCRYDHNDLRCLCCEYSEVLAARST